MDVSKAIYTFYIGGIALDIKPEAIIQLIVVLLIGILAWWSTKDLKRRPEGKKQIVHASCDYVNKTLDYIMILCKRLFPKYIQNDIKPENMKKERWLHI